MLSSATPRSQAEIMRDQQKMDLIKPVAFSNRARLEAPTVASYRPRAPDELPISSASQQNYSQTPHGARGTKAFEAMITKKTNR